MVELENIKRKLIEKKAERNLLINQLAQANTNKEKISYVLDNTLKARQIVQDVAEEIQKTIEFQISNLVSTALSSVFPDPYTFKLSFVQRRNKTECDLLFVKNGEECDPFSASGGGAIDIANFALRIAIWSIKKTQNVFILDEPFRFVSVDLQEKCSQMMKEISEKLGIQIIMVSHLPNIIGSADQIFQVENIKGISKVKFL
jgi:DNA repair exonuclease SbcCD ATPase subunit